jgi:hypothetical protein
LGVVSSSEADELAWVSFVRQPVARGNSGESECGFFCYAIIRFKPGKIGNEFEFRERISVPVDVPPMNRMQLRTAVDT